MYFPIQQSASPQAKELAGYLEHVVDAYRENHSDVTSQDVSTAFGLARVHYAAGAGKRVFVAIAVLLLGAALMFFSRVAQP